MNRLLSLALFIGLNGASALAITDLPAIPNNCYDTLEGGKFCTHDKLGDVQVLVFNAGWCPPCNAEMAELPHVSQKFNGRPVTFVSLSGEGWKRGSQPDKTFLESWKAKHKIPFVVAGKYRDFGKDFGATGTIPFVAIIDQAGNVAQKGGLSVNQIQGTVTKLLNQSNPE